jgi:LysM repeat protein
MLARANNLSPGAKLTAGSRLILPGMDASASPAAGAGPVATAKAGAGKRTARYKVHKGDTLEQIARVYGVTPERLAERNRLKPGDPLLQGTVLVIPLES